MDLQNVVLDLDGTLIDSFEGIYLGYVGFCQDYGLEVPERNVVRSFIGPPIRDALTNYFDLPEAEIERGVASFRRHYIQNDLLFEKYDGIDLALLKLKEKGLHLFIATSKLETMAVEIVIKSRWSGIFDAVAGAKINGAIEKIDILRKLLIDEKLDPKKTIMIGDRDKDVSAGKACGTRTAAVLWGFGGIHELGKASPDLILGSTAELIQLLHLINH